MKNPLFPLVFYGIILPFLIQTFTHNFGISCIIAFLVGAGTQKNSQHSKTFLLMLLGVLACHSTLVILLFPSMR